MKFIVDFQRKLLNYGFKNFLSITAKQHEPQTENRDILKLIS